VTPTAVSSQNPVSELARPMGVPLSGRSARRAAYKEVRTPSR
jgi:hypothetical protein